MLGEEGIQLTLLGWEGVVGGRLPGGDAIGASTTRWRKEEVHSRMTVQKCRVKGIGMGNTCKSMADSCQCMAKTTTIL